MNRGEARERVARAIHARVCCPDWPNPGCDGPTDYGDVDTALDVLWPEVDRLTRERDDARERSDVPGPCRMTHTAPFDFAQCETHDETFPIGGTCRFHGRDSVAEVYAEEADAQRRRAVLAEGEVERLARERDTARADRDRLADVLTAAESATVGYVLVDLLSPGGPQVVSGISPMPGDQGPEATRHGFVWYVITRDRLAVAADGGPHMGEGELPF